MAWATLVFAIVVEALGISLILYARGLRKSGPPDQGSPMVGDLGQSGEFLRDGRRSFSRADLIRTYGIIVSSVAGVILVIVLIGILRG
jgi:hypothetical protein